MAQRTVTESKCDKLMGEGKEKMNCHEKELIKIRTGIKVVIYFLGIISILVGVIFKLSWGFVETKFSGVEKSIERLDKTPKIVKNP